MGRAPRPRRISRQVSETLLCSGKVMVILTCYEDALVIFLAPTQLIGRKADNVM